MINQEVDTSSYKQKHVKPDIGNFTKSHNILWPSRFRIISNQYNKVEISKKKLDGCSQWTSNTRIPNMLYPCC